MRNKVLLKGFCLSMVAMVIVALPLFANAQRGNNKPIKTTNPRAIAALIYCAPGDTVCEQNNRARMDVDRPYVDGEEGVQAEFQLGSGSNDLTVYIDPAQRHFVYDFTDVYIPGNPVPDWWYSSPIQTGSGGINVRSAYTAKEMCGGAATCDVNFVTGMNGGNWDLGPRTPTYRMQWNPDSNQPYINYPETVSYVNVHYTKDASGEMFVITPIPTPMTGLVLAGLQTEERKSVTPAGQYIMPFTLVATFK